MRKIVWFIPSVLVFLGIFFLSTMLSVPIQLEGVSFLDKIEHTFAYFVLIITLLFGFYKGSSLNPKTMLLLMLGCSFYGVLLEWIQFMFFPNRYFEWFDALANVSGVLLGSLVFRLFRNG